MKYILLSLVFFVGCIASETLDCCGHKENTCECRLECDGQSCVLKDCSCEVCNCKG